MKTMCSSCMQISDTKLCIRCKAKAHRERATRVIVNAYAWAMRRCDKCSAITTNRPPLCAKCEDEHAPVYGPGDCDPED